MKKLVILTMLTIAILASTTNVFAHWREPENLIIQDPAPKIFETNNIK